MGIDDIAQEYFQAAITRCSPEKKYQIGLYFLSLETSQLHKQLLNKAALKLMQEAAAAGCHDAIIYLKNNE